MPDYGSQTRRKEKVLVSGSNGFLGNYLCRALVQEGYALIGYDRNEGKDITDFETLKKSLDGVDYVFHLAAELDEKSRELKKINVEGTKNILEASAKQRVKKFIFLSSVGVMGRFEGCADEGFAYNPITPYEKSKAEAEKLVLAYQEAVPVVIVRPALVLGPNSYWKEIIGMIEKKFPILGNGKNSFQTVYIKNLVEALMIVFRRGEIGEVYIAADNEIPTLEELYINISKELGADEKPRHANALLAKALAPLLGKGIVSSEHIERLVRNRCYNNSKLKKLGFVQRYPLLLAIKNTVAEIKMKEGAK